MFKVTRWTNNGNWSVTDERKNYMHSDGSVYHRCGEYWPLREQAQAVLDKYPLKHVWEHGDVFKNHAGTFIYLERSDGPMSANLLETGRYGTPDVQMRPAAEPVFLFNIREKL